MQSRIPFLFALLLWTYLDSSSFARPSQAQAAPAQDSAPTVKEGSPASPESAPPASARDETPMSGIGIGLKLGYLNFGRGSFKKDISGEEVRLEVPTRDGLALSIPINFGSSGFGWIIEPYFGFGRELKSMGLNIGPTIVIHVNQPLYFGFGINLRVGYLLISDIDIGFDFYGRIPVTLTYYVIDELGILAELGFGYGGTGIRYKEMEDIGLGFGTAVTVDFSMGVRFP